MMPTMKFRGVILVLGSLTLLPAVAAQNSGTENLPSTPSATKQSTAAAPASEQPAAQTETPPPATSPAESPGASPSQQSSPGNAAPNNAPPSQADIATTIRKTVNEVNVVFTVIDRHGHYVRSLKKDDFHVLDDGQPPAEIRSFHSETDLPLLVGLLVDASNSVRDRFKFEQESAIEFLNQTVRPKYDRAFVVGFDATPEVTQDFTDNTEFLSRGVRALLAGRRHCHVRRGIFRLPRQALEVRTDRADAQGAHSSERWRR